MELVRRLLPGLDSRSAWEIAAGAAIGFTAMAALFVGLSMRGPVLTIIALAAVPVAIVVLLRPRYGVLLLIFAMAFVEEFRGGIGDKLAGGDEHLRSERTLFYAATLGLPALYLPDVMVGGTLVLYLVRAVLWRADVTFRFDKIGFAVALLLVAVLLSILVPLAGPDPFGPQFLDLSTIGSVTLPEKNVSDVARYLPVLQYKLFMILFPTYVLGLFFFRERRDVEQTINVVGLAMVATVGLGLIRLGRDPGMIKALVPVIFDTASVALMGMTVFYAVGRWASGHYTTDRTIFQSVLCVLLMVFILLSFRRMMWGAIFVAALFFPFLVPRHALKRLFALVAVGAAVGLAVALATPPGRALLESVMSRAGETNLSQSSTLYRFAITVWLVENVQQLPLFGYGLAPMWNEKVYIRFFVISMENVHSLFLWVLLRMGVIGFLAACFALGLVMVRIREVFREVSDELYRIVLGVIFLSIVMYVVNGFLNPVYANVRHLVALGLSLALVTQLPHIDAAGQGAAKPRLPR